MTNNVIIVKFNKYADNTWGAYPLTTNFTPPPNTKWWAEVESRSPSAEDPCAIVADVVDGVYSDRYTRNEVQTADAMMKNTEQTDRIAVC